MIPDLRNLDSTILEIFKILQWWGDCHSCFIYYYSLLFFCLRFFFTEVQLTYDNTLVSGVQGSDSTIIYLITWVFLNKPQTCHFLPACISTAQGSRNSWHDHWGGLITSGNLPKIHNLSLVVRTQQEVQVKSSSLKVSWSQKTERLKKLPLIRGG